MYVPFPPFLHFLAILLRQDHCSLSTLIVDVSNIHLAYDDDHKCIDLFGFPYML